VTNTLRLIAFAVSTALFFNLLSCFTSVEIARGVRGMNSASMRLLRASEVMHYSTALVGAPTPALQAVARSSLRGSVEQMQTLFVRLQQETSTSQINLFFKREPRVLSVLTGQGSVGKGNITSVLQQNTLDSVASFFMRKASSLASEPDSELGLLNQDYEDTATLYKNVLVAGLQDSTAIYHMELSQQVACVYQILHCLAERQGLEVIFCLSLTVRLTVSPPHRPPHYSSLSSPQLPDRVRLGGLPCPAWRICPNVCAECREATAGPDGEARAAREDAQHSPGQC
jgi:hypothetical protein